MPGFIPDANPTCARCSRLLVPGALACEWCHALVYAGEMERLAAQARGLEGRQQLMEARNCWLSILPLLPPDSQQADWIRGHAKELEAASAAPRAGTTGTGRTWVKRLGPLGPVALMLAKFKTFFLVLSKLKFFLSFASFIGVYWALWGPKFGIGFALLVLIHEMGHYVDIKRRGLPVDMPMFLPGLGAYVRWNGMGVSQEARAAISLAGPLAGWLGSAVCMLLWRQTQDGIWGALARVGAWFNVLNLTPVWIFDGAQAARALRKTESALLLLVSAAFGYALHEGVFYIVAAGAGWVLLKSLLARSAQGEAGATLGLGGAGSAAAAISPGPENPAGSRPESHAIAAYFIAVLTALALLLWVVPGRGSALP